MAVGSQEQVPVDLREAALTMAIAVVVDRIRGLSKEDKEYLFDLSKALFAAETEEEVQAAVMGFHEILEQSKGAVRPLPVPEESHAKAIRWTEYVAGMIKAARIEAGMTQVELEIATGLPQSHISRLEAAVHSPSRSTIEKIARALGKPLSYFDPTE